jgi:phage shock protein A
MQARAGAIDELIASGALEDVTGGGGDDITRELESMSSQADVEAELAALKAGTTPPAPQAIEAGEDGGDLLEPEPEKTEQGEA